MTVTASVNIRQQNNPKLVKERLTGRDDWK